MMLHQRICRPILLLLLILAANASYASSVTYPKEAKAYYHAIHAETLLEPLKTTNNFELPEAFTTLPCYGDKMKAALQKPLTARQIAMFPEIYYHVFGKAFTTDELSQMTAFYTSELGKKLVQAKPVQPLEQLLPQDVNANDLSDYAIEALELSAEEKKAIEAYANSAIGQKELTEHQGRLGAALTTIMIETLKKKTTTTLAGFLNDKGECK